MTSGWYGFDLDGTLARYDGWVNALHVGEPIAPMVDLVKKLLVQGYAVKIVTARVSGDEESAEAATVTIQNWTELHIGARLPVTCRKDFGMITLYDDRCVQVECNTGRIIGDPA